MKNLIVYYESILDEPDFNQAAKDIEIHNILSKIFDFSGRYNNHYNPHTKTLEFDELKVITCDRKGIPSFVIYHDYRQEYIPVKDLTDLGIKLECISRSIFIDPWTIKKGFKLSDLNMTKCTGVLDLGNNRRLFGSHKTALTPQDLNKFINCSVKDFNSISVDNPKLISAASLSKFKKVILDFSYVKTKDIIVSDIKHCSNEKLYIPYYSDDVISGNVFYELKHFITMCNTHKDYYESDKNYKAYEQMKNVVKQNPGTEIYIAPGGYEFTRIDIDMNDNLVYDDQISYM